jgi:Ca2+-binding RTX toxin-like protein
MTGKRLRDVTKWLSIVSVLSGCVACSGNDGLQTAAPPRAAPVPAVDPGKYEGIKEIEGALVSTNCTTSGTLMTLPVAEGETLQVSYRPGDDMVVLNGNNASGGPCEIPAATGKLKLLASGTGVTLARTVILDYSGGLYMKGVGTAPGITIDFTVTGGNSTDTVQVRGTTNADKIALGAGVSSARALNMNAGSTTGLDSVVDVTMKSVENVTISAGDGDDVINASGVFGTGAIYPTDTLLLGGDGNDTITGGAGSDTITGGNDNDQLDGGLGNDIFKASSSEDGADTILITGTTPGADTVDYSARKNDVTLTLDGSTGSGESGGGEGDKIPDKIATVIGGAGDDTITISPSSTLAHTVLGGSGADTFNGGLGADVFDGQSGSDVCHGDKATMSYATRALPVVVTIAAGTNDGYAAGASGSAGSSTNAGTTSDKRVNVAGLTGATDTAGRLLTISGFTTGTNDGTYPVVSSSGSTAVVIDTSSNAAFDETALGGTLTWSFIAEADDVDCANVVGGLTTNTITGDVRANLIRGGAASDTLKGGGGRDQIYGGGGNDALEGGDGDDMLYGDDGDDTMYGGLGNDALHGGDGNDTLVGGDDDDIIEGDAGADTFNCDGVLDASATAGTTPGEIDITVDYTAGVDTSSVNCER